MPFDCIHVGAAAELLCCTPGRLKHIFQVTTRQFPVHGVILCPSYRYRPRSVPEALLEQLKPGGRMVIPAVWLHRRFLNTFVI